MKFLVATHSYLLTVEVNDELELQSVNVLDEDYYYGSDVLPDGTIIAAKRLEHYSKMSGTGFRCWGQTNFPPLLQMTNRVRDIHQMTYDRELDCFYLTSTHTDEIYKVSANGDWEAHDVGYLNPFGGMTHCNSIDVQPEGLYIVLHNSSLLPSEVVLLNREFNELSRQVLSHLSVHNILVEPANWFCYNASDNGAVVRGQWGSDDYEIADVGSKWHPKGMCQTQDYIISGYSEHAVDTPRRFISQSGLAFVSKESWDVDVFVDIQLEDGTLCGNINELRIIAS